MGDLPDFKLFRDNTLLRFRMEQCNDKEKLYELNVSSEMCGTAFNL